MFIRQLDERAQISVLPLQILDAFDVAFDGGFLSAHSGGSVGVFPKVGMRRFLFEVLQVGV